MVWAAGDYFSPTAEEKWFVATVQYGLQFGCSHLLWMKSYLLQRNRHLYKRLSALIGLCFKDGKKHHLCTIWGFVPFQFNLSKVRFVTFSSLKKKKRKILHSAFMEKSRWFKGHKKCKGMIRDTQYNKKKYYSTLGFDPRLMGMNIYCITIFFLLTSDGMTFVGVCKQTNMFSFIWKSGFLGHHAVLTDILPSSRNYSSCNLDTAFCNIMISKIFQLFV